MDIKGTLQPVKCSDALPVLCSQSAPVSAWNTRNASTAFQVSHRVGRQTLTGYRDHYAWKFLGIRFAPPTTRFEYSTVLDDVGSHTALDFGAPCLQPAGQITPGTGSDDCLFLNIWTPTLPPVPTSPPTASKPKLKPVAFYIYGGGLTTGDSANPNTDGTNLASRGDVVVVALNYRLGNLGLLSLPQSGSSKHNGNYGLGDQITALQWVRRNIASFGGDPARVTIFGESAGAESVHALLSSPMAKGLFINAVMQSDPQGSFSGAESLVLSPQQSYETFTRDVLNQTRCGIAADVLACLVAYDGEKLAALPNPAK
jgi:carboxylesterase type B